MQYGISYQKDVACGGKDPSQTHPPLMPNRHALVEAYHPPGKEDVGHVGVPLLDHLRISQNLSTNIGARTSVNVKYHWINLNRLQVMYNRMLAGQGQLSWSTCLFV